MHGFIERSLLERRSLEQTLADLVTKNRSLPSGKQSAELTRMIQDLGTEIARRAPATAAVSLKFRSPAYIGCALEKARLILAVEGDLKPTTASGIGNRHK